MDRSDVTSKGPKKQNKKFNKTGLKPGHLQHKHVSKEVPRRHSITETSPKHFQGNQQARIPL